MSNNFLSNSSVTTSDISTETTLKRVEDTLLSGVIIDTTIALDVAINESDITGEIPVNLTEILSTATSVSNGIADVGCQRICVASDNSPFNVKIKNQIGNGYLDELLKDGALFNVNLNYSGAGIGLKDYVFESVSDGTFINRILIYLEDTTGMRVNFYTTAGALTNGVKFFVRFGSGGGKLYINEDIPIKSGGEYAILCHDVKILDYGAGNDAITVRWTFMSPINITTGFQIGVEVNDDLTGLISHYFRIQGCLEP